jgi:hypothetical protein
MGRIRDRRARDRETPERRMKEGRVIPPFLTRMIHRAPPAPIRPTP